MNHPKVQLLINMGTNKLKQGLDKAKNMVDNTTSSIKDKLSSIEIPSIKTGRLSASLGKIKSDVTQAYQVFMNTMGRPIEAPEMNTSRLKGSLGGIKSAIIGAIGITAITAGIGTAISSGLDGAAQKVSFQTMGGDAKGGKLYDDLTKFAQDSIFGNELYQNAQTMLAFGQNVDTVVPKLKMLGDISMGNKEKLGSLTLAYSQIQATGRLMGQDLLQLINAGFNPLQIISEKTGIGMGVLKKRMEEGAISADLVTKAFESATGVGGRFYQMTERIAATEFGQLEALKGQLQGVALQFGTALLPAISQLMTVGAPLLQQFGGLLMALVPTITTVIQAAMPLLEIFGSFVALMKDNVQWVGLIVVPLIAATGAYRAFTLAQTLASGATKVWTTISALWTLVTGGMTVAQWNLNAALTANPIGIIIGLIVAAVAAVVYAYKHFDKFRAIVDGAWAGIKQFGSVLYELTIGHVKNLITGLGNLGNAIYLLFTGEFKAAAEEGKKALLNLSGANTISKAYEQGKLIGDATKKGYTDSMNASIDARLSKTLVGAPRAKGFLDSALEKMNAQSPAALTPDKATADDGKDWKVDGKGDGKGGNSTGRVTGSAQQTRNVTINFGSYIKGDVISKNQNIQNMSADQLDRWLREHFQRLIQSVEGAY